MRIRIKPRNTNRQKYIRGSDLYIPIGIIILVLLFIPFRSILNILIICVLGWLLIYLWPIVLIFLLAGIVLFLIEWGIGIITEYILKDKSRFIKVRKICGRCKKIAEFCDKYLFFIVFAILCVIYIAFLIAMLLGY